MAFSTVFSFARSLFNKVYNWLFPEKNIEVHVQNAVIKRTPTPAANGLTLSAMFASTQKTVNLSMKLFPCRTIELPRNPFLCIIPGQSALLAIFGAMHRILPLPTAQKTETSKSFIVPFLPRARRNFASSSTLLSAKVCKNGLALTEPAPFYSLSSAVSRSGIAFNVLSPYSGLGLAVSNNMLA